MRTGLRRIESIFVSIKRSVTMLTRRIIEPSTVNNGMVFTGIHRSYASRVGNFLLVVEA